MGNFLFRPFNDIKKNVAIDIAHEVFVQLKKELSFLSPCTFAYAHREWNIDEILGEDAKKRENLERLLTIKIQFYLSKREKNDKTLQKISGSDIIYIGVLLARYITNDAFNLKFPLSKYSETAWRAIFNDRIRLQCQKSFFNKFHRLTQNTNEHAILTNRLYKMLSSIVLNDHLIEGWLNVICSAIPQCMEDQSTRSLMPKTR
jgi:hypothetical protein